MRRTDHTPTGVSRRTVVKGATVGLLSLGGIGTATAQDDEEDALEEAESGDEDESSDVEEGERSASVTIPDQEISGGSVRVTGVSLSQDGYMSIHDIIRFSGADVSDVEGLDGVPERTNPICGSIIGITELLPAGEYAELEVPLYNAAAPAVGTYGHFPQQSLQESQPLIAIPHSNDTDEDEFVCGEDPPDDGAVFASGTVDSLPIVNDVATVTLASDSEERKERARRLTQAILDGTIVPPSDDEEVEETENDDGDEAGEESEDEDEAGEGDEQEESGEEGEEEAQDAASSGDGDGEEPSDTDGDDVREEPNDGSADDEGGSELPEQADDRAREARENAPGSDR